MNVRVRVLAHTDGAPSLPPFPAIVRSLLASLAATLSVFAPLAGRLAAFLDGDLVVDCSLDALQLSVKFVQAEYSGDAADGLEESSRPSKRAAAATNGFILS